MTTTTDVSPPADDSGVSTEQPRKSQHRPSRLNQALAWVGIVAGGLFIVAAIFFSGFFLSSGLGGPHHGHMGSGTMACCSDMKADEHMKPGAMMGPDGMMEHGAMMGPGATMGPAPHSPATSPNIPRP
jgi:hypothetical protein